MDGFYVPSEQEEISRNNISWTSLTDVRTARDIWVYGSLFMLVLGTVGNLLTVCVMLRPKLRMSTTSVYMVSLAASDTLVLYTGLLRQWIRRTFSVDVRDLSHGGCVSHLVLVYFTSHLSAWILVCVTMERFIMVFRPLRAKILCSRAVTGCSLGLLALILFILNSHFLWSFEINPENERCDTKEQFNYVMHHIWPWVDLVVSSLIPFLIMVVLNSAMIIQVCVINGNHRKGTEAGSYYATRRARTGPMSAVLIVITSFFIATTLPLSVHLIQASLISYSVAMTNEEIARSNLLYSAFAMVAYLNNSVNFFLYCISGRKFRKEFISMLHPRRRRVEPVRAPPTVEQHVK